MAYRLCGLPADKSPELLDFDKALIHLRVAPKENNTSSTRVKASSLHMHGITHAKRNCASQKEDKEHPSTIGMGGIEKIPKKISQPLIVEGNKMFMLFSVPMITAYRPSVFPRADSPSKSH